jgi:hypothetical protein
VTTPSGGPVLRIGRAIYDVTDPVRPELLCRFVHTTPHLYSADTLTFLRDAPGGAEVMRHSMSNGEDIVISSIPLPMLNPAWGGIGAWTLDGSAGATTIQTMDAAGNVSIQVWLYAQRRSTGLYSFRCR